MSCCVSGFGGVRESDKGDVFDASVFERGGACGGRCACRDDIVDERDVWRGEAFGDLECAVEVVHALVMGERGLVRGVSRACEDVVAQFCADAVCLERFLKGVREHPDGVEAAFSETARMRRHGDDAVVLGDARLESVEVLGEEVDECVISAIIFVVFPLRDHLLHGTFIEEYGACGINIFWAFEFAVGFDGSGAFLAEEDVRLGE